MTRATIDTGAANLRGEISGSPIRANRPRPQRSLPKRPGRSERPGRWNRSRTPAFTILELLLVLGLMVMVAGLAWPRVTRSLQRAEHRAAAESVQTALAQLRLRAIETGTPHMFRFRPGTGDFEVRALPPDEVEQVDFDALQGSFGGNESPHDRPLARSGGGRIVDAIGADALAAEVPADGVSTGTDDAVELRRLENRVVFLPSGAIVPGGSSDAVVIDEMLDASVIDQDADALLSTSDRIGDDPSDLAANGLEWSPPIVFYPDGRADDTALDIVAPTNHRIAVTIVGLTGEVRLGPRRRMEPDGNDERTVDDVTEDFELSLQEP